MTCIATAQRGFTLIELSIVLVIIGLIVGGVLVGQDLIRAAAARAQISQIERYQTAVNTFRVKYGYLPGDIKDPDATNFGFAARGQYAGEGHGNGVIEGAYADAPGNNWGNEETAGETVMFWVDLSAAHLIEGRFNSGSSTSQPGADVTGTGMDKYLPAAKIDQGNYLYVWSGGYGIGLAPGGGDGNNYFGLSAVNTLVVSGIGGLTSTLGLTVQQAYSIDKKADDGYPQSGFVTALYFPDGAGAYWAGGDGNINEPPYTTATAGSASTCFDNGNVGGTPQRYSLAQNGGAGINCALSFRFQ